MADLNEIQNNCREMEILYSRTIWAGERVYYLDVKRNQDNDLFLAITESKKKGGNKREKVFFERHKLFLYQEDFSSIMRGLEDVFAYIQEHSHAREDAGEQGMEDSFNLLYDPDWE